MALKFNPFIGAFDIDTQGSAGTANGNVIGPASTTDKAIVRFNGTSGTSIQNSAVTIDDNGGIISTNPSLNAGTGVLYRNNGTYEGTVGNGTVLILNDLNFHNHGTVNTQGLMYGMRITTDSEAVDTAAGAAIFNNGQSDGLYIRVAGKSGTTASLPTGIGMDYNRSGTTENSSANQGYGIQIWDWSVTDTTADTPTMLYLSKHNNPDTNHLLAKFEANQKAVKFVVPHGGAYSASNPLVQVVGADGTSQTTVITAGGNIGVTGGTPSLNIESSGTIGIVNATNNVALYLDNFASGIGRIVSEKNDFSNTGRQLSLVTQNSHGESVRIDTTGHVGIGTSSPSSYLHLKAGGSAASSSPLKLTTGSLLSTAEDGAIEYSTSHLYFTIGTTRYQIDQQSAGTATVVPDYATSFLFMGA